MASIRLEKQLAAPIDHVFELLSDHANYERFPGITDSKLVREGTSERNGVGALRSIAAGPIRFEEEITAFERPNRMDYLIRRVNVPIEHEGGTITLEETAAGITNVLWLSTFKTNVPVLARPLGSVGAAAIRRGFVGILNEIERLGPRR